MIKALLVLSAGAFVSQTTEYLPIGLLSEIATDLNMTEAKAGLLITAYAWIITLSVIPVTLFAGRFNRKNLFIFLLGLITLCNSLVILSDNFLVLLLLRIFAALGHGVFWANIASYALRIAKNMPASRATAIVFSGISLSIVLGIPLSNALGQHFGWQNGFAVFGLLSFMVMCCAVKWLPHEKGNHGTGTKNIGGTTAQRSTYLYLVVGITLLLITANFNSYTYVTVFLQTSLGVGADRVPLFLLIFGIAGALGTVMVSCFAWRPVTMTLWGGGMAALSYSIMLIEQHRALTSGVIMFIWGFSISFVIIGLQSWVIETSPEKTEFASALYVMSFNIGIGAGAVTGGKFIGISENNYLFGFSAIVSLLGLLLVLYTRQKFYHEAINQDKGITR